VCNYTPRAAAAAAIAADIAGWTELRATDSAVQSRPTLLWPPYVIGQAIIFLPCRFFFFYLFFLA